MSSSGQSMSGHFNVSSGIVEVSKGLVQLKLMSGKGHDKFRACQGQVMKI